MPKKRNSELVKARYADWRLKRRGRVFVADGRSNNPPLGRHSLDTDDYNEALEALTQLDLFCAIKQGKALRQEVTMPTKSLTLADGSKLYQSHVARPKIVGGANAKTIKRYRAVFDKFLKFAASQGLKFWNDVTRSVLEEYAAYLDDEGYAYATEYLELITLKQAMKWFVEADLLPSQCLFRLPVSKPHGTSTYCYRIEEFVAIVEFCKANPELTWLHDVVVGLGCTGLRISELASLRRSDIDFENNLIRIVDETALAHRMAKGQARQTKTKRSRSFPIVSELKTVLENMRQHPDGMVFHGPRGGKLKPDTVRRILIRDVLTPLAKRFPKPEGEPIGFADGRLHSFRHYFCSVCARSVTEQVAMNWLGHSSSRMLRRYFHLYSSEAQHQMKKLDFFGSLGPTSGSGQSES
jgi:integrase